MSINATTRLRSVIADASDSIAATIGDTLATLTVAVAGVQSTSPTSGVAGGGVGDGPNVIVSALSAAQVRLLPLGPASEMPPDAFTAIGESASDSNTKKLLVLAGRAVVTRVLLDSVDLLVTRDGEFDLAEAASAGIASVLVARSAAAEWACALADALAQWQTNAQQPSASDTLGTLTPTFAAALAATVGFRASDDAVPVPTERTVHAPRANRGGAAVVERPLRALRAATRLLQSSFNSYSAAAHATDALFGIIQRHWSAAAPPVPRGSGNSYACSVCSSACALPVVEGGTSAGIAHAAYADEARAALAVAPWGRRGGWAADAAWSNASPEVAEWLYFSARAAALRSGDSATTRVFNARSISLLTAALRAFTATPNGSFRGSIARVATAILAAATIGSDTVSGSNVDPADDEEAPSLAAVAQAWDEAATATGDALLAFERTKTVRLGYSDETVAILRAAVAARRVRTRLMRAAIALAATVSPSQLESSTLHGVPTPVIGLLSATTNAVRVRVTFEGFGGGAAVLRAAARGVPFELLVQARIATSVTSQLLACAFDGSVDGGDSHNVSRSGVGLCVRGLPGAGNDAAARVEADAFLAGALEASPALGPGAPLAALPPPGFSLTSASRPAHAWTAVWAGQLDAECEHALVLETPSSAAAADASAAVEFTIASLPPSTTLLIRARVRAGSGGSAEPHPVAWSTTPLATRTTPHAPLVWDHTSVGPGVIVRGDDVGGVGATVLESPLCARIPAAASASFCGFESWSLVRSCATFSSGVSRWRVRLDTATSVYVFIGVASAAADPAHFLGSDEHGFGWLGDGTLYHNHAKLGAFPAPPAHPRSFCAGDVIGCELDADAGTLSFELNGEALGVAFWNLTGPLAPAVAFYSHGTVVTLLPWESTASGALPPSAATATSLAPSRSATFSHAHDCPLSPPPPPDRVAPVRADALDTGGASAAGYGVAVPGTLKAATLDDLCAHDALSLSLLSAKQRVPRPARAGIRESLRRWIDGHERRVLTRAGGIADAEMTFDTSPSALEAVGGGIPAGSRVLTSRGMCEVIGAAAGRLWVRGDGEAGAWWISGIVRAGGGGGEKGAGGGHSDRVATDSTGTPPTFVHAELPRGVNSSSSAAVDLTRIPRPSGACYEPDSDATALHSPSVSATAAASATVTAVNSASSAEAVTAVVESALAALRANPSLAEGMADVSTVALTAQPSLLILSSSRPTTTQVPPSMTATCADSELVISQAAGIMQEAPMHEGDENSARSLRAISDVVSDLESSALAAATPRLSVIILVGRAPVHDARLGWSDDGRAPVAVRADALRGTHTDAPVAENTVAGHKDTRVEWAVQRAIQLVRVADNATLDCLMGAPGGVADGNAGGGVVGVLGVVGWVSPAHDSALAIAISDEAEAGGRSSWNVMPHLVLARWFSTANATPPLCAAAAARAAISSLVRLDAGLRPALEATPPYAGEIPSDGDALTLLFSVALMRAALVRRWNDSLRATLPLFFTASSGRGGVPGAPDAALSSTPALLGLDALTCALRPAVLRSSKRNALSSALDATATLPRLAPDDFDFPNTMPCLELNRPRAAAAAERARALPPARRLVASVFWQAARVLLPLAGGDDSLGMGDRAGAGSRLRVAFVHAMDDGQARAFRVRFAGEAADDYSGLYREFFSTAVSEVADGAGSDSEDDDAPSTSVGGSLRSRLRLPLLARCGDAGDALEPRPDDDAALDPLTRVNAFIFLGVLIGIALRTGVALALPFTEYVWESLARGGVEHIAEERMRSLVASADPPLARAAAAATRAAVEMEGGAASDSECPPGFEDLLDTDTGKPASARAHASGTWFRAAATARVHRAASALSSLSVGLESVVPAAALRLFTASDLERAVCGAPAVDVDVLEAIAEYDEGVSRDDPHVIALWRVLRSFNQKQRAAFLRFVWARERLPATPAECRQCFRVQEATPPDVTVPRPPPPPALAASRRPASVETLDHHAQAEWRVSYAAMMRWRFLRLLVRTAAIFWRLVRVRALVRSWSPSASLLRSERGPHAQALVPSASSISDGNSTGEEDVIDDDDGLDGVDGDDENDEDDEDIAVDGEEDDLVNAGDGGVPWQWRGPLIDAGASAPSLIFAPSSRSASPLGGGSTGDPPSVIPATLEVTGRALDADGFSAAARYLSIAPVPATLRAAIVAGITARSRPSSAAPPAMMVMRPSSALRAFGGSAAAVYSGPPSPTQAAAAAWSSRPSSRSFLRPHSAAPQRVHARGADVGSDTAPPSPTSPTSPMGVSDRAADHLVVSIVEAAARGAQSERARAVAAAAAHTAFTDSRLPTAHACFFSLHLPRYSSEAVLRERLLYAIENCTVLDADFRATADMATAWADSEE